MFPLRVPCKHYEHTSFVGEMTVADDDDDDDDWNDFFLLL